MLQTFRLLFIIAAVAPWYASAASIDLTRYLQTYDTAFPQSASGTFIAQRGTGRLIVTSTAAGIAASIELNGTSVAGLDLRAGMEMPVDLQENNTVNVIHAGNGGTFTL